MRSRRRLLALAAAAAAAALGAGIYALVAAGSPAAAPPCRSSQISLSFEGPPMGRALSGDAWLAILRNTQTAPCSLPLRPPAARVTWRGTLLSTTQTQGRSSAIGGLQTLRTVRVLEAGTKAGVSVEWQNWCGPPHSYRPMMTVHLRFDPELAISWTIGPRPACRSRHAPSTLKVSEPLLVR